MSDPFCSMVNDFSSAASTFSEAGACVGAAMHTAERPRPVGPTELRDRQDADVPERTELG